MDAEDLKSTLLEYYQLGTIARNTIQVLSRFIVNQGGPRASQQEQTADALSATLEHLAAAREGFQLQLRSSAALTLAEMQYVIDRAMVNLSWLEGLGWELAKRAEIDVPRMQLLAFHHAYISLAMLPH